MRPMRIVTAVVTLAMAAVVAHAAEPAALVLERSIALPNTGGRIDHMAVDLKRGRLFVAELGNGSVDVVDIAGGGVLHRIAGLKEPQGVGYEPASDTLAVANAGDGAVLLFRGEDYAAAGRVDLGDDADNVRVDRGRFVVGYGSGGLAATEAGGRVVGQGALPAHPEGFQIDPTTRRAYVNVPDARLVAVVDLDSFKVAATWRMGEAGGNFPMAFDTAHAALAVVFRSPARLLLFDTASGQLTARIATCGDADDVFFDAKRRRIYVSCGAGSVDVFQADERSLRLLARITTASGARTALFVPELDRLFVAAPAGFLGIGKGAEILVFRPG